MGSIHLIGGGWDPLAAPDVYGPFLDAAGSSPVIACVVIDEGDGGEDFARWAVALGAVAACEPVPVIVPAGSSLDVTSLGSADGLLVCGGLTPAYASALSPAAQGVRTWLADRPYCGFSAGAAVAAQLAVVGGWRDGAVPVCPEDASEDLEQVSVVDGLGLVGLTVDVHCAQWGTLPRLVAALGAGGAPVGVGIDENTCLHVVDGAATVTGLGAVHHVTRTDEGVQLRTVRAGEAVPGLTEP
jgi:cyanophycinase